MVNIPHPTHHSSLPTPSLALATELLHTYGSPLYVYDGDHLRHTIAHITAAFPYPHTHFHFASVTNGNIALLKIFRDQGWGLHANSPGDVYLGLQAGFAPGAIVYSGSNLDRAEMAQLLGWGIRTFNLDSVAQLELLSEVWRSPLPTFEVGSVASKAAGDNFKTPHSPLPPLRLGLRLNHPTLTGDSRIGVRPQEFSTALEVAASAGLKLSGLHFYRGTGTNATQAFTEAIDEVIAIAQQFPDWDYLDFGGGFGYPYHHDGATFNWNGFGNELSDRLAQLTHPVQLIVEPGRAAIAGCATLLCQVVSVKWQDDKQIIGTDTTVANLSVPSVHGGYREIVVLKEEAEEKRTRGVGEGKKGRFNVSVSPRLSVSASSSSLSPQPSVLSPQHLSDVCGNTTYSRDYLGRNCLLPALQPGDILAIADVGAYGYAMSSHFLHRPRPAEVLLEGDAHRLIRRREDYGVLLANQVF